MLQFLLTDMIFSLIQRRKTRETNVPKGTASVPVCTQSIRDGPIRLNHKENAKKCVINKHGSLPKLLSLFINNYKLFLKGP